MSVKLRKKKISPTKYQYYLDIYQGKGVKRERPHLQFFWEKGSPYNNEHKKFAEEYRNQVALDIASGGRYKAKKLAERSFLKYLEDYVLNYSKKDKRIYKGMQKKLSNYLESNHQDSIGITHINFSLCDGFHSYLKSDGLAPETIHNYFTRFRRILERLVRDEVLKKNPAKEVRVKRPKNAINIKKVLFEEELKKLNVTPCTNATVKNAFLFACFTGLGYAELKQLKWEHIDKDYYLYIPRSKSRVPTKFKLNKATVKYLPERNSIKSELVFTLPTHNAVTKSLKVWVRNAGIEKKITPHCARHTFAIRLLRINPNLKTVANLMGHTSVRHTEKYLNALEEFEEQTISQLPSLE